VAVSVGSCAAATLGSISGQVVNVNMTCGQGTSFTLTYSNAAKQKLLGVPAATLLRYGAVSGETAAAMAKGALKRSGADLAVSVTGIAGPAGGSKQKPVGLVHLAAASRDGKILKRRRLFGKIGRRLVRERSVVEALALLVHLAKQQQPASTAAA